MMTTLTYRPDIDGLRALSVLVVMAHHAGLGVSGGYIGVDVFFAISGFLITSLIVKDLDKGRFSLAQFWERRIRRIWPAVMATTLAVLAAGFVLMLPRAFTQLGEDAAAQALLLANVQFWRTTDYFAVDAALRPLLHTWSLAVEEQFYLAFPPLLMIIWRYARRRAALLLIGIAVVSFGISVWGVARHPVATFYLLPTRAWELLAGALLAIVRLPQPNSAWMRDGAGVLGLLLIGLPAVLYDTSTPFPGVAALPPCIGALLLIYVGLGERSAVTKVLSIAPLRVIGLMSYSLYLWHWPILAFMRYTLGELSLEQRMLALAGCAVLSFLSWRFIETPVRNVGGRTGLRRVAAVAGVVSALTLAACAAIYWSGGVPRRFHDAVLVHGLPERINESWATGRDRPPRADEMFKPIGAPPAGSRRACFLLWGDSHAMAISETIDAAARKAGVGGVAVLRNCTVSVPGVGQPADGGQERDDKVAWNAAVVSWIRANKPTHVIVCSRWSLYVDGEPNGSDEALIAPQGASTTTRDEAGRALASGLESLLKTCADSGSTVWLLTEIPYQPSTPERRAVMAHLSGKTPANRGVTVEDHRRHQRRIDAIVGALHSEHLRLVDLATPCFDDAGKSRVAENSVSLYFDEDHLNTTGFRVLLGPTIDVMLSEIAADCATNR